MEREPPQQGQQRSERDLTGTPVELLGMQVIDQLIQDEVTYYKGIYEQEGIKGLLDSL